MMTSTVVFDRAGTVLGQPFVLGQLAELVKLDEEHTRRLVAKAAAVLIAGLAERTTTSGIEADQRADLPLAALTAVGPGWSWAPDGRLPDAAEIGGEQAASYLLGARQTEWVTELARVGGVEVELAELLVTRIAPVVTSAVAEIRSEFDLSERGLTRHLREEHRTLVDLGLVERSNGEVESGLSAPGTRNVARVRVSTRQDVDSERPGAGIRSDERRPWIWWSLLVVASMVAIAMMIGTGDNKPVGTALEAHGATTTPAATVESTVPSPEPAVEPTAAAAVTAVTSTVNDATDTTPRPVVAGSVPEPVAPPATSGTVLNELLGLEPITFEPRSADLTPQGRAAVDRVADYLLAKTDVSVEVGGHTDNDGRASDNQRLSLARAASVVERLIDAGVDAGRLTATGFGEAQPAVPNDSSANKALNRRIEFMVR
ncbi:MAG: OmpA family protein [Acidimicrobiia bacterium]|nr:OmpA family protein [Acidimicrobiia bacterium]